MRIPILIGLLAVVTACPALPAQRHDGKARDITSREEYRGYRVERPPGYQPGGGDARSGGQGDSGRGAERESPQRDARPQGRSRGSSGGGDGLSFPDWLGTLFEVLAWIVLIAGVAVALFFIVKALLGVKWKRRKKPAKSKKARQKPESKPGEEPDDEAFDESVFEDALQEALRAYKQALARENYAEATLLAYRIFWLRAGWQGCVENSDVRTWRDALRMVRRAETRREVRELLPMVERVRYADYVPRRPEFELWSGSLERIDAGEALK
jgi:hypothetical protein